MTASPWVLIILAFAAGFSWGHWWGTMKLEDYLKNDRLLVSMPAKAEHAAELFKHLGQQIQDIELAEKAAQQSLENARRRTP